MFKGDKYGIYQYVLPQARYETRSIFKLSEDGLNLDF